MEIRSRGRARRPLRWLAVLCVLFAGGTAPALAFSGEDPMALGSIHSGGPWHHADLSRKAAEQAGFTGPAAETVAWHADYIDSYLYNPLWWAAGGIDRYKAALATYDELAKLHFDDLFSSAPITGMWDRYYGGTVAGLMWAQEHNDVSAARNILGVSLHAIQDFYSHSNWIDDPARRNKIWSELAYTEPWKRMAFFTGAYEHAEHLGVKHHGKIAPACTVLNNLGPIGALMTPGCSVFSPLNKSGICQQWRECRAGMSIQPTPFGLRVPSSLVYLAPAGIALDSTWAAAVGVKVRGLTDLTGDQAFNLAYSLALRQSVIWLQGLEGAMRVNGGEAFWNRIKSGEDSARQGEYETYHRFPYQFLSAGPYPPSIVGTGRSDEGFYLRVRLKTSRDTHAGTDADIYLKAGGKEFLLDYLPVQDTIAKRLIAYNDFEAGDDAVYTVGPFSGLPPSITLENRAATAGGVLEALGRDVVRTVEAVVSTIGDFLLSLIGGHADLIGKNKQIWWPADLAAVPPARVAPVPVGRPFTIDVNGGDEGHYRVHGMIAKTGETAGNSLADWADYQVTLARLECVRESKWDRGSDSDEPFVMALLIPLGTTDVLPFRTQPFSDVDDGESRDINFTFPKVRIPKGQGNLSLAISVMESDDETSRARDDLLNGFAGRMRGSTATLQRNFLDAMGSALAAGWKLEHMEVYAFRREHPRRYGTVFNRRVDTWIEARRSATFDLNAGALNTWQIGVLAPPGQAAMRPAFLYAVDASGAMQWFRHDGAEDGSSRWAGPHNVGSGWAQYPHVFAGGGNIVYAVTADGSVKWFKHNDFMTGIFALLPDAPAPALAPWQVAGVGGIRRPPTTRPGARIPEVIRPQPATARGWEGPKDVGNLGPFARVFSGSDGVIYTITVDGKLIWRRHLGFLYGGGADSWQGPKEVGVGWGEFQHVFSTGDGVIYTVAQDGKLLWYKHNGYLNGRGLESPGAWEGPKTVTESFGGFRQVFSAGDGILYAITADGVLKWYRHVNYRVGLRLEGSVRIAGVGPIARPRRPGESPVLRLPRPVTATGWRGPQDVGTGWNGYTHVFALLPRQPDVIR